MLPVINPAIVIISFLFVLSFSSWVVFSKRVSDTIFDRISVSCLAMLSLSGIMTQINGIFPLKAICYSLIVVSVVMAKQLVMSAIGNRILSRHTLLVRMQRSSRAAKGKNHG